jgi:hypothetical protein
MNPLTFTSTGNLARMTARTCVRSGPPARGGRLRADNGISFPAPRIPRLEASTHQMQSNPIIDRFPQSRQARRRVSVRSTGTVTCAPASGDDDFHNLSRLLTIASLKNSLEKSSNIVGARGYTSTTSLRPCPDDMIMVDGHPATAPPKRMIIVDGHPATDTPYFEVGLGGSRMIRDHREKPRKSTNSTSGAQPQQTLVDGMPIHVPPKPMRIVDGHRATDEGTVYRKPAGTVPPDAPTDEIITNHDNKVTANEAENDEDTDTSIFQGATALAKKVLIAIIKELILLITGFLGLAICWSVDSVVPTAGPILSAAFVMWLNRACDSRRRGN